MEAFNCEQAFSKPELVANEFTLNAEQCWAFLIIACHTLKDAPPLLHMYIGRQGRMGKSHIIQAVKEFLAR